MDEPGRKRITHEDIQRYDPMDMHGIVLATPAEFRSSLSPPPFAPPPFSRMVYSGMGASAIAGEVLSNILDAYGSPVQVFVNRKPSLPSWTDHKTLVVVCSYSGNTMEALESAKEALAKGLDIVAVTAGGKLEEWALEHTIPTLKLPGGIQPRAAFPHCMAKLLSFATHAHDAPLLHQWTVEACDDLDAMGKTLSIDNPENPAMRLSEAVETKMPIFYGEGFLTGAARRASCQFNENSKMLSFHGAMPEMNHNEIVGWASYSKDAVPVFLAESRYADMTAQSLGGKCIHMKIHGRNPLSKALCNIYTTDMASVYSAVLGGVDPTPVEPILRFKAMLNASSSL